MTAGGLAEAPATISDPVNAAILAVSEDRLAGFQTDPSAKSPRAAAFAVETVIERIVAMLKAGTIRRVRQTLLSTSLARGALCAWEVPAGRLDAAFDYMFREDPFSGHVVIRTTDAVSPGSSYRLWTTLKVPQGFSLRKHARMAARAQVGARALSLDAREDALHAGRRARSATRPRAGRARAGAGAAAAIPRSSNSPSWTGACWSRSSASSRPAEIVRDLWARARREAGVDYPRRSSSVARSLNERGVIGRFSTFLEHVKPTAGNERVTRYNALFHWAVPPGREIEAGCEVGRHYVITHAYWREGGPEFHNVNVMAVAHGMEKAAVLAHKAAIDEHLREAGIDFDVYQRLLGRPQRDQAVGDRASAYREFCAAHGIDPEDNARARR